MDENPEQSFPILLGLMHTHFRSLLEANMDIVHTLVTVILEIIQNIDPPIGTLLSSFEMPPFYFVSWILTWFAHDVKNIVHALSLFDFFIANHPSAILYACAVVGNWKVFRRSY